MPHADRTRSGGETLIPPRWPTSSYFHLPNLPGTTNNYLSDPTSSDNASVGDVRVDHHFSVKDTLFVRYSYNRNDAEIPNPLPAVNGVAAGGLLSGTGSDIITVHNGLFGYTHIFTPSLLMDLRAGYTYFDLSAAALNSGKNLNDSAPFRVPNANECISCSGLAPDEHRRLLRHWATPIALPANDIEHVTQFVRRPSPTFTVAKRSSSAPAPCGVTSASSFPSIRKGLFTFASSSPGASLAAFLQGAPYIVTRQLFLSKPYERSWESAGYFQDDWRATDHLTLNLGIRYDVFAKPDQKENNFSNFNLSTLNLIVNNKGGIQTQYKDFSPRLGFDATIAPGSVLRGGFGLTFFPGDTNNSFVLANPPLGYSSGTIVDVTPISTTGAPPAVVQSTTGATISGAVLSKPLHEPESYLEQFNLLLQKEYRGTVLSVGYVGELGRHLYNEVPNANLPAPSGPSPANALAPALLYAAQLPLLTTISYFGDFGSSSYNSMQVSVERRVSHGLTANFNYTYAHTLDDVLETFSGDISAFAGFGLQPSKINTYDYGNSPLNLNSRFAGFFSYDLPLGKSGSRLYKAAAGGFRFNGLGFWQTGSPFTVTSAVTQNGRATINLATVTVDKPNVVAPIQQIGQVGAGTQFFSISSFAQQPLGTAGNERRGQLSGPDLRRGDISLFKTIPVREGVQLELRAECINFTNTPNFAKPNFSIAGYTGAANAAGGNVASSAGGFGSITSTAFGYSGRQFQFAGRFTF